MKKSTYLLSLMAALTLGTASAATEAGIEIVNVATATFEDPTGAAGNTAGTSTSNPVTTTVLPVPSFTVTPNNTGTAPSPDAPDPTLDRAGVLPGSVQQFRYTVTNTGNTPVVVQFNPDITALNVDRTNSDVQNLTYFAFTDTNNNGVIDAGELQPLTDSNNDGLVESPAIASNAAITIVQSYKIPDAATAGTRFGANPVATGLFDNTPDAQNSGNNTYTSTVTVTNNGVTSTLVDNNNFNRSTVYTPGVSVAPIDANGVGGTTPAPGGNTDGRQDPPAQVTPGGTLPAYNDPNPNGGNGAVVLVGVNGNNQSAFPKADAELVNDDRVTFINSVTNSGTQTDSFLLLPPLNLPAGVTVTYFDAAGNALPTTTVNGVAYGTLQNVTAGETRNFRVQVNYPDTGGVNSPVPVINVEIGIDSLSDADILPNASSTDTVFTPDLQFGDSTLALGTSAGPVVTDAVTPGTADTVAFFPMDVFNAGGYTDTFTLSGSVPFTVLNAGVPSTSTVTATYYTYTDVNNDGTFTSGTDTLGSVVTSTGPLAAGAEFKVVALVTVPANTRAGLYTVSQSATGNYSTISRGDTNDVVQVLSTAATVTLAKSGRNATVNPGGAFVTTGLTAKPTDTVEYRIIATNTYNTDVRNFILTEQNSAQGNVFTYGTFAGVSSSTTQAGGTVLYRFNGGAWQTGTALPGGLAASAVIRVDVGVDTNADINITRDDVLSASQTVTTNFTVTVK
ncbi:hypothetical protein [Deinococcus sp. QL22]|uniref:beta strand repeat-containing protein n=1 Tax=Deinococcus sp. QL22 TaxID=2939437 RepID=UPI002017F2BF|nr:hypothetical protein [Deinococcus sp. QL22]UQN07232.1 hypothetical protein M1R55_04820 [Deinococcus sp. QL22]